METALDLEFVPRGAVVRTARDEPALESAEFVAPLMARLPASVLVRIAGATYVRPIPGRWSKLRKPRPVTDPAGTLLAVLRGLRDVSIRTVGSAQVVSGSLPDRSE